MTLEKQEAIYIKDALIEYWHNQIKHSKNKNIKSDIKCLIEDFKTICQLKSNVTITVNK